MKRPFLYTAIATASALSAPVMAASCDDLANLSLHAVGINSAAVQGAQTLPPDPMSGMTGSSPTAVEVGAHCLVEGKIEDRQGVNGRYGIRFQLRMPQQWNGRFLFQGGGGTDGFIAPAIGTVPSTGSSATPAIKRGYAVVSMDGGHNGRGFDFAADQQARVDLGYASIGKVTATAKTLIRTYYNKAPVESYFMGCSNGGREAMMAAQRFPLEFDGIVAGNPGFHLSRAAVSAVWEVEQFEKIASPEKLYQAFSQSDLDTVSTAILQQCDGLDGLEDGIVTAYAKCDFNPQSLRGKLDDDKLETLITIMQGATDEAGNQLYTGWPWDPAINTSGWRAWKIGSENRPALHQILSVPSTGAVFMTPTQSIPDEPDFVALSENVAEVGGYFDANDTYMTTFADRGGKMVIFQGLTDQIFSAIDIADWYEQTQQDTGTEVARLFMVPGMTHCGGGNGLEDFDPLTVLENWRSTGKAPETMTVSGSSEPARQMPLCAYPDYANYTGGDKNKLESYTCVTPE